LKSTRLSILIFCTLLTAAALGQSQMDNRQRQKNAQNRIKNQESWDYKYDGKAPGKAGSRTSVTTFTSSGDIDRVVTFSAKGEVQHIEKYNYDKNGRRTEYTRMSGENAQKPSYQKISAYNTAGDLSEEKGFDGVENFRNVYLYNASGDLAEISYYKNNNLREKRRFTGTKTLTNVEVYNGSGNLMSRLEIKYNANGDVTEETIYGVNQAELEKKVFNYDQKSNLTGESRYKLEKITLSTTYTYNSAGDLLTVYEESPSYKKFLKKSMAYDSQGNLKEIKWRRNPDEEFNMMVYNYDNKGICVTVETFYPVTDYRVLTKYVYAYY